MTSDKSSSVNLFHERVTAMLHAIHASERENLHNAAELMARQVERGGKMFTFGTGHSHLIAEEAFGRAGGPTFVHGIWMSALMLHEGLYKSTRLERVSGIAQVLLEDSGITAMDVLLVVSNSGRNAVPIEMALTAQKMGVPVIAITSKAHSESVSSRHSSGLKLRDIANVVLDNHGIPGDAAVPVKGADVYAGPTSTITGSFIIHSVLLEVFAILEADGYAVPVLKSGNV